MTIQIIGNGGSIAEVDGTTFRALRTVSKPIEYGVNGHYSRGAITGILTAALAANSEIFQFLWSSTTLIAIINRVRISACISTTFGTSGTANTIALVKYTGSTAIGTGGTSTATGATCKGRTTMASSAVGDFRISTTAALGAGTKTLEANPLAQITGPFPPSGTNNGQIIAPGTILLESSVVSGMHPLILGPGEGFSITSVSAPAAGTWTLAVDVMWTELAPVQPLTGY